MLTKKIESERLTFPNNNQRYSETNMMIKSLSSIKNKNKYSINLTQQNSAKRDGYPENKKKGIIKKKNFSK